MKTRFLYLGRSLNGNKILHHYIELSPDNKFVGNVWNFNKKLHRKGVLGAIYGVKINGDSVKYSVKDEPHYLIETGDAEFSGTRVLFREEFSEYLVKDHLADIEEKLRKRPAKEVYNIEHLKSIYNDLSHNQRAIFIADLVREITK